MRILVISDIHANLTAFEAVLADARGEWDEIWCLGDVIGYGPDPNECVDLLRSHPHTCLRGNHDLAGLGEIDVKTFNPAARRAIEWTQAEISDESRRYLEGLPSRMTIEGYTIAHASPRLPVWEYVLDEHTARENLKHFDTDCCLVGHTHVALIFASTNGTIQMLAPNYKAPVRLVETRTIVNPGSVGQPRDHDPRAAYGLLDLETASWQHRRVPYDIAATQQRMAAHRLPPGLISRLQYGQ